MRVCPKAHLLFLVQSRQDSSPIPAYLLESAISMLNDMWGLSSLPENHHEQNNLI